MKENKAKRAKKIKEINGNELIATVDVGKTRNMGYYRLPGRGGDCKPFGFSNNGHGFHRFWSRICKAQKLFGVEELIVGFESTGSYGLPLVHYLRKRKVRILQVNPMHTKRLKELQGNSPNKTDAKDPKVIADIIGFGHALSVIVPEGAAAELRSLTHARQRSLKVRGSFMNQLQALVFEIFPEFLQVMKGIKTKTARYLVRNYPRPQDIMGCNLEVLGLAVRKVSQGQLGEERVRELFEAAGESVGIFEGREGKVFEISHLLESIERHDGFVDELEAKLSCELEKIEYSKYLLSMKGIGVVSVAGLIGEVGDFTKFRTISELMKLAGLDLYEVSSGDHQGKRRISKRGRPLMRKILFFIALNMVRKGGVMHERYQRHLEGGMPKPKALVAISRRVLVILFALARDHSEYIEGYGNSHNVKEAA